MISVQKFEVKVHEDETLGVHRMVTLLRGLHNSKITCKFIIINEKQTNR